MTTQNGYPPDNRFPIFLAEDAETTGQPDIGQALVRATILSRILKISILGVTTAAVAIAILMMDNPVALLTDITASWFDKSALQTGTEPSTSTAPSIAATQDLPPAGDTSTRDETAAAPEPAGQSPTEIAQAPTEGLLKQFQSWATDENTRAPAEPAVPPEPAAPAQLAHQEASAQAAQDTPVRVVHDDARARVRPVKKHRRAARSTNNARAEFRPPRNVRAQAREEQDPRVQAPPAPDARAPEQPAQSQTPWFLQGFGSR